MVRVCVCLMRVYARVCVYMFDEGVWVVRVCVCVVRICVCCKGVCVCVCEMMGPGNEMKGSYFLILIRVSK